MHVPDVSVVVIVYNDAERLPAAVQSVLDQTLRGVEVVIVDDCSKDASFAVARELEAAHPGRVRAFRLPENSGGCGAPRNHGIQRATGTYVMFLDSDDVLERNACRNMLAAAQRTGADLVSGMCVRVHLDDRWHRTTEWYPWIYSRTRTLESITEYPDLLVYDTLSTNKCYRRAFLLEQGLEFPVGIHYEDLLFSAQAYVAARRITLIPNHVYFWNVIEKASAKSISNRRHEIENFVHRMEIHRRVDELLAAKGHTALKSAKDTKFLKHDLVLHLRDLPLLDDAYRREFARLANGYLAGIDPAAYESVNHLQAICAYLLGKEDWDNLLPAADAMANKGRLSSPLAERDGRVYWCAEHLDDTEGRRILDVTDQGFHTTALSALRLGNRLTSYADDGRGTVTLSGSVVNPLGRIKPDADLKATLEFRARRQIGVRSFSFPVATVRHAGDSIEWTVTADVAGTVRPLGIIDAVWDVRLKLTAGRDRITSRVAIGGVDLENAARLRVRPRLTRLVSDRFEPEMTRKGNLSYVLTAQGPAAVRTRTLIDSAMHGKAAGVVKRGLRRALKARRNIGSGEQKVKLYHEVFSKLPVRKGTVVFESHMGKQYSDSPRAIYEELVRQDAPFEAIWSYAGAKPTGFPPEATLVKRWSWPYLRALAQAEYWVDNQGFPLALAKRPGTTYIQTWHGSALKRMGFHEPRTKAQGKDGQDRFQAAIDRFDHFLIRSEHDARTLAKAFRLREEVLLRTGYPRNDALVAAQREEAQSGERVRGPLAAELGIDPEKKVLLYAPTFRAGADGAVEGFEFPFDVDEFADRLGDRFTLLVRTHYLNSVSLPPSVAGRVVDVSRYHDITPLLALADALITDYSSVMFDYAVLDRPMFFFAYDYDKYATDIRGTYFDLKEKAPGPVVATADELLQALAAFEEADAKYAEARQRFLTEFGEYDHGDAARRIVAKFFTRSGK
ncbi:MULTISPECIES: bifunctional glycosyltransferase family 2 protein/CDP-glycerol:glycerophosphate glycerophosphotransferase [unclassified Streptomyces]|uniref:bifunctional glycosyltransferase/CDP-glycerol:glycerophosphate glycerophosphotransferase n=1 Tax=unclassified Streptomyces TaxID=2593676 RepID=UPI0022502374|nr:MULTISPECIES: bifunctional glycosyltransferase family 2 protein/CDP-glycerol:glycerophosphate glycerophosphotransferase [unclassified Streptomyces]MCX4525835.1 bifunctional glycosyltransferase family 2 protein/CDP-glycerol:glycerophosphate glycerophosphotransferase [Streptomyces sp. NBC_01551]MCX4543601.1 bifunctional glycosyltransferase family 2 protein/CDP-glycerol:glycerophosphate glycerophosphotransferase [Streptomyces sp. NBC_01565]